MRATRELMRNRVPPCRTVGVERVVARWWRCQVGPGWCCALEGREPPPTCQRRTHGHICRRLLMRIFLFPPHHCLRQGGQRRSPRTRAGACLTAGLLRLPNSRPSPPPPAPSSGPGLSLRAPRTPLRPPPSRERAWWRRQRSRCNVQHKSTRAGVRADGSATATQQWAPSSVTGLAPPANAGRRARCRSHAARRA